ncbi:MAG: T9SS type A sorting domain-containing protein [Ignavibacteria bacterium]|nr:T9SS type A sorting domain-containing protein [Ignavibacteria bacterium]
MSVFQHTFRTAIKLMVVAVVFFVFVSSSFGQEIKYRDSWGSDGFTLKSQNPSRVEINFSINTLFLNDVNVKGQTMKAVAIAGAFLPNDEGMPDLAGMSRFIAIPQGANVKYRIINSRTEKYTGIEVAPAPRIPWETESGPLDYNKNSNVYSKNSYYPESVVQISEPMKLRGVDAVIMGITPYQYNPVTKELIVYKDLQVEISFIGGNGKFGEDRLRSRWFDPILEDNILNFRALPKIDYGKRNLINSLTPDYEYLIIRPNGAVYAQWADSIKNFRNKQGIRTGVVSLTELGGNTTTAIETYINNAYNTWTIPPVAVLFMGDYGTDANINVIAPIYNNYCASDNIYCDIDGDHLPELAGGRMTANDATQLQVMVTKFLNYERQPETSTNFYHKPITALGWQTERWFQICSEAVGGFFKKIYGKLPTRINAIYSGSPTTSWSSNVNTPIVVGYFGPAGTYYIPLTPDSLGGWSGGTAQMVIDAINAGAFMLQHRDHGSTSGWGEPAFQSSHINSLTNVGSKLPYIFSVNCLTGQYNLSGECFAEKFHRHTYNGQNAGCVGILAASQVSYSFVNDVYVWGMYDNMWPNFMPTFGTTPASRDCRPGFGNSAGKIHLYGSSWPYNPQNKEVTYHLFHNHTDAFMQMFYMVPTNMTISHNSTIFAGATTFSVTADSGAFICLSLDGVILGTATSIGGTSIINIPGSQIPPQIITVTATKQNKFRYEAPVTVVAASGPYVVQDSVAINDASPLGNGNGLMDYGETNKLSVRLKNVGVANATNVSAVLRTTDTYITLTDSTETYGNINAGASMMKNDAFTYTVANNIPDNRVIQFQIIATDGTNEWTSGFSIIAHAPVMELGTIAVNDSAGNNNGRWDINETVMLRIEFKNTGSSDLLNAAGKLIKNSSYVTLNTDSIVYGTIPGDSSIIKQFSATSSPTTPAGHSAQFFYKMYGNLLNPCSDTFNVTIGQNVFTIGTGTTTSSQPYYSYYADSRTNILYTAAELIAAGLTPSHITHIGFDIITRSATVLNGFEVKFQNTTVPSITTFTNTGWTTCYNGTYTVPGTGWQDIPLMQSFYWDGTSNLLIEVCFNNSGYGSTSTVRATSATAMMRAGYSSSISGCTITTSYTRTYKANLKITIGTATNVTKYNQIPEAYSLSQNYPNPFNPVTKIGYAIPKQGLVTLKIYDVLGREVAVLINEEMQPGYYSVDFDASYLASGIYFYKLESGTFGEVKRMVIIK